MATSAFHALTNIVALFWDVGEVPLAVMHADKAGFQSCGAAKIAVSMGLLARMMIRFKNNQEYPVIGANGSPLKARKERSPEVG